MNLFTLPGLIAGLGLISADRVAAQTFTNLHSFTYGSDGGNPSAGLILSGNTFYGTTTEGNGISGRGTVFAVNTDGTGFTNLYAFTATSGFFGTNSDGAEPVAGLILSGDMLYGTAYQGGASGRGTVFAVNTNGTAFTNLHSFTANPFPANTNSDGASPYAGLVLSGNTLYGTALYGGSSGNGTVFALNTDGTGFTNLHSFTAASGGLSTNSDGVHPFAALIVSGNILYGTAHDGGSSGNGTVFSLHTDGTGFTNLHDFTGGGGAGPFLARLLLAGNTLYGTAAIGGSMDGGTVFSLNTDGTGFTNLHNFTTLSNSFPYGNDDGAAPWAGLILFGNTLYGTAEAGGTSGNGAVFAVNTDGTSFVNLHNFTAMADDFPYTNSDGAFPRGTLVLSGNTLYGTAYGGGSSGYGTVFSLSLPPPSLAIVPSGVPPGGIILTWPTNAPGFTLQATTNLIPPAVWNTVSPAPVVVNGKNAVTNPMSGTQMYFRLSQ